MADGVGVPTEAGSVSTEGDGVGVGLGILATSVTVVPTRTTWPPAGLLPPTRLPELTWPATVKPAALS